MSKSIADEARAAGLSEDEVAGISGVEDDIKDDAEALKAVADESVADDAVGDGEKSGESAAEATATDDGKGEAEGAAKAEDETPSRQTPFAPQFVAGSVEAIDARLWEIKAEQRKINISAFSGEASPDDVADQLESLQAEREYLVANRTASQVTASHNAQQTQQYIEHERGAFFREANRDGIDYRGNNILRAAFDAAWLEIVNDPKNVSRGLDAAYDSFVEAHAKVRSELGLKPPAPALVPAAKPAVAAAREVPKTLAGLPAAGAQELKDDTYERLKAMSGEDLELELAKLPKGELDRIMRLSSSAAA